MNTNYVWEMYYLSSPKLHANSESFPSHLVTACPLPLYYGGMRLQVSGQGGGEKLHTRSTSLHGHDKSLNWQQELDQSKLRLSK